MGSDPVLQSERGYRYSAQSTVTDAGFSGQGFTALGFATLCALHFLLTYLDCAILSPLEICWNALVFLIPARLLAILAKITRTAVPGMDLSEKQTRSQLHAQKSEILRHLLRINPSSAFEKSDDAGDELLLPKTNVERPPGLGNWDNSCYQNSVLQSLAAVPSVLDFLDTAIESLAIAKETTTGTLRSLTHDLATDSNNGRKLWTPAKLKSMSSWQQQDAQEYYSRVLGDIEQELKKSLATERPRDSGLFGLSADMTRALSRAREAADHSQRKVPLIPLEGLLGQRVACVACGYSEGISLLPFNCLTVTPGNQRSCALEELLDDFTNLESIDSVECLSCTFIKQAKKLEALLSPDNPVAEGTEAGEEPSTRKALPPAVQEQVNSRLETIKEAIEDQDFSDKTATQCSISKDARVSGTKTKQVVIARPPQSLAIHVNRSIFDEQTGSMAKNLAHVVFPKTFSLDAWIIGQGEAEKHTKTESWPMSPRESLAPRFATKVDTSGVRYELKAVVSHYGRHENGHYICYRQHDQPATKMAEDETAHTGQWWRLSDETVTPASEEEVMHQGGVFMLFYERVAAVDGPPAEAIAADVPTAEEISRPASPAQEDLPVPAEAVDNALDPSSTEATAAPVTDALTPADVQPPSKEPTSSADVEDKDDTLHATAPPTRPFAEAAPSSPQMLRTSRLGADVGEAHLVAGRPFVTV